MYSWIRELIPRMGVLGILEILEQGSNGPEKGVRFALYHLGGLLNKKNDREIEEWRRVCGEFKRRNKKV